MPSGRGRPSPDRRVAVLGGVREATALLDVLSGPASGAQVVGVVVHDERESRRGGLAVLTSRARTWGVPVLTPRGVTLPAALEWLRRHEPDFLVCASWTGLLTPEMLRVPRSGAIGLRTTVLSGQRREVAPDWALVRTGWDGEPAAVVLAPGSAARDVSGQGASMPVDSTETCGAADPYDDVAEAAVAMLSVEAAEARGPGRRGTPVRGTAPLALTSFDRRAEDIVSWVSATWGRGLGAYARIRGDVVLLLRCEVAVPEESGPPPGTVLGLDGDAVLVTTRLGVVRLLDVQLPGHAPERAGSWMVRQGLPPGCAFEPVDWSALDWLVP